MDSTNTTFDEVYELFDSDTRVDKYSLPSSIEGQYKLIQSGLYLFNFKLQNDLQMDMATEMFNRPMTNNEKLMLCSCMRLVLFRNMQTEFISTIGMNTKDSAISAYSSQASARSLLVENEEKEIKKMMISMLSIEEEE